MSAPDRAGVPAVGVRPWALNGRPRPRFASVFRASAPGAFLVLGLTDGMLGVAWPSIRAQLGLPLDALGDLLVASTIGYLCTAISSGFAVRRANVARMLMVATLLEAVGAAAMAGGQTLALLVAGSALLGVAAGAIDPALSSVVSLGGRRGLMNVLHATYGVGAAVAPLVLVAALRLSSWRLAYITLAVCQGFLASVWLAQGRRRVTAELDIAPDRAAPHRASVLAMSLLAFFFASGLEIATASWSASYLDGRLHASSTLVAVGVAAYWTALAGSRFAAAAASRRMSPAVLAPISGLIALVGAVLVWAFPLLASAIAGFAVLGFGIGPIFPALTLLTPDRVGRSAAPGAIGWQLAAGSIGSAGCSSIAGLVLEHDGLSATGPVLVALALGCLLVLLTLERSQRLERGGGRWITSLVAPNHATVDP